MKPEETPCPIRSGYLLRICKAKSADAFLSLMNLLLYPSDNHSLQSQQVLFQDAEQAFNLPQELFNFIAQLAGGQSISI